MKKFIVIIFLLLLSGCTVPIVNEKDTLQSLLDSITLDDEIDNDIQLPENYQLNSEEVIALWESDNPDILNETGTINRGISNTEVTLNLTLYYQDESLSKDFTITVKGIGIENYLDGALNTLSLPTQTEDNLVFMRSVRNTDVNEGSLTVTWESSNPEVLSNTGKVGLVSEDTTVTITASVTYESITRYRTFPIVVLAMPKEDQVAYVFDHVSIEEYAFDDINLPTTFAFGLTGTWSSSNPDILSDDGELLKSDAKYIVTLTLTLNTNDRRTFEVMISKNNHLIIDNTFTGDKANVVIDEFGKLVLDNNETNGTYTTPVIETLNFTDAVASWAATSSTVATCELLIKVRVNGTWSQYFTYGEFGLDLNNICPKGQSDAYVQLSTDELLIKNSKTAEAIQMQIKLKRQNVTDASPKVTLLAVTLHIPDYNYNVDITNIRQSVDYDVPKLNQNIVPGIGSIICSATSSTMLLKYKGHDFSSKAQYEHQYIAAVVKDNGNGIYGNWVYNTVGISSFGETSYVKRMYSYQELLYHLDTVGPVAASVKGTMIGEIGKTWTTSGHLIVVRGYRIVGDQIYILANDPNLSAVYEEYKLENFMNVWRNIAYVIE